jgi:hypothetical protein
MLGRALAVRGCGLLGKEIVMDLGLRHKAVLVTGATRGIGRHRYKCAERSEGTPQHIPDDNAACLRRELERAERSALCR